MSKHTPGPWHLMAPESLKLEADGFTVIAETARHAIRGIYQPHLSEKDNETAYALDAANAALIAAAPEMLEALLVARDDNERAFHLVTNTQERMDSLNALAVINKAIAKARGES